jgi:hypothetical protein
VLQVSKALNYQNLERKIDVRNDLMQFYQASNQQKERQKYLEIREKQNSKTMVDFAVLKGMQKENDVRQARREVQM